MRLKTFGVFALISICGVTLSSAVNFTSSDGSKVSGRTLSRKKRYLTFPAGSILQLGYCLTIPMVVPDTIWYYGITFGTNWEIPSDPPGLPFRKEAEVVHRRQRRDLYQKLIPMLNMMGLDGKSCLLRALCESGQRPQGAKGSFLEEILHAIFTLPKITTMSDLEEDKDFKQFDSAHGTKENCEELFPSCLKDLDGS